jgi:tetratricopeptide (TPR) repeat protein
MPGGHFPFLRMPVTQVYFYVTATHHGIRLRSIDCYMPFCNGRLIDMAKDSDPKHLFEQAKKLHNRGVDGDKKAVREAHSILARLRAAEPGNALVEAFYGSSLALLARDAVQPLEKAEKAQDGLDALDRAVALDPNHKEIRLLRANVCARLPEAYFQCSDTAIEDFNYLLNRYHADPGFLSKKQAADIMRNLAKVYQNAGRHAEAGAVLQRLGALEKKK